MLNGTKTPKNAGSPSKLEGSEARFPLEPYESTPLSIVDFRHLASRPEQNRFLLFSFSVYMNLFGKP